MVWFPHLCTIRSDNPSIFLRGRIDGDDTMGAVAKRHRLREGIAKKMECIAQFHLDPVLFGCHSRFFFIIHVRILLECVC